MIPSNVSTEDLASVTAELERSRVGIIGQGSLDPAWRGELIDAQSYAQSVTHGSLGFVAVDTTPQQPADLRDIAQVLQDTPGLDTVVVRAPHASGAVSQVYTRDAIEAAQQHLLDPNYATGLREFAHAMDTTSPQWTLIAVVVCLALACVVGLGVWMGKRHVGQANTLD